MNVMQWAESRSRALTVWDTAVLKTYCVLFGAVVGAYASAFVQRNVGWFVAAVLLLGGYFAVRWFTAAGPGAGTTPSSAPPP